MPKTPTNIRSLARSHTKTALNVLAGIMAEAEAPHAARVAAANALLDRGYGKPSQDINMGGQEDNPITSKIVVEHVRADGQDPNT